MIEYMLTTPVGLFLINLTYTACAVIAVTHYAGNEIERLRDRIDALENKEIEEG
jgi:hypothetical protein